MDHSIELIYDADIEVAVRHIWDALRDAGIPSQSPASRPHTTVAVAAHIPAEVDATLVGLLGHFPLPCRLGATLLFGRSAAVLARLVVPSAALLRTHAEVHRACLPFLLPNPLPHNDEGQWTPHVTLARRVSPARLAAAQRIAGRPDEIAGSIVGLRRWEGDKKVEHLIT